MSKICSARGAFILSIFCLNLGLSFLSASAFAEDSRRQQYIYYRHAVRQPDRSYSYELVQHRLPYFDNSDEIQTRQRKTISNIAGQIVAVGQQEIFCRENLFDIIAVDIETGEKRQIIKHQDVVKFNEHRAELLLLTSMGGRLQRYNLSDEKLELLAQADPNHSVFGTKHHRVVLSPDGQKVAFVSHSPRHEISHDVRFRLDVIDLATEVTESKHLTHEIYGKIALTGGGDHIVGPPIVWKDERTVVLLTEKAVKPLNGLGDTIVLDSFPTQSRILAYDVESGEETEICKHKSIGDLHNMRVFDHHLWRRSDGAIMLSANDGSDFRIDFEKGSLVHDSRLSPHYEFRRTRYSGTLLYHGQVLAEGLNPTEVSLAPDGRAIVWVELTGRIAGNIADIERSLFYHSLTTGKHELAKDVFRPDVGIAPHHPSESQMFLWGVGVKNEFQ